jgi:hypothetical protein
MAYSDFTWRMVYDQLGLSFAESPGIFAAVAPVPPSDFLNIALQRGLPVALGKAREKARSEALVLPVLLEVREQKQHQVSIFSGTDLNVDRASGLAGYCDFLISRSPLQVEVFAPIVTIVEAKHEDLNEGIPQCLAEMHAARLFNAQQGQAIETVYGATTSGTAWRFLRLTGTHAEADLTEYHISHVEKILGILLMMVSSA